MRARCVTASLVTMGLLAGAPTALAGTVSSSEGFQAAPGEKNDVTIREADSNPLSATVVDLGAPLTAGEGCTAGTPVFCSRYPIRMQLGDRADRGNITGNCCNDGYVYGEDGADDIHSDGYVGYAYGGSGGDKIRVTGDGGWGYGGGGGDTIIGGAAVNQLVGEGGSDHLVQGNWSSIHFSVLDGGPGSDTLAGLAEAHLFGGDGDDGLWTSDGRAYMAQGGAGRDFIVGGSGKDTIDAGPGADYVQVAPDNFGDTIVCGTGDDTVRADPLDTVAADCEHVTIVGA
jgi:RTX calcium-binding nonapeptide repeat (4 copies)